MCLARLPSPGEKPMTDEFRWAWGIIGFRKQFGRKLLNSLLESTFDHQWKQLDCNITYIELSKLSDVTRGQGTL